MSTAPQGSSATLEELLTATLVSDALDALGYRNQCLGWDIVPLPSTTTLVGRAFPWSVTPSTEIPEVPYRGLLAALDAVGEGDVVVIPTQRATQVAVWGELLSTSCQARGARGVVTDGMVRDAARIGRLGFPVFGRGTVPYDIHGRLEVTGFGEPVEIDGVRIRPNDMVVADADGAVIVPQEVTSAVVDKVKEKAVGEDLFRKAVADGELPSDAFTRYRVL